MQHNIGICGKRFCYVKLMATKTLNLSVTSCRNLFSQRCIFIKKEHCERVQSKIQSRRIQFKSASGPYSKKLPIDNLHNLTEDVLLFSYEKSKVLKYLAYFGMMQLAFWVYLGSNMYINLRDVKQSASESDEYQSKPRFWRRINLGEKKYKIIAFTSCLAVGLSTAFITWALPFRIIKHLVLCKGGDKAHIVTYGTFGRTRELSVPLAHLNCQTSRTSAKSYIPLQIKGHWLYFLLDVRGTFKHPQLFDFTVGAARVKLH